MFASYQCPDDKYDLAYDMGNGVVYAPLVMNEVESKLL